MPYGPLVAGIACGLPVKTCADPFEPDAFAYPFSTSTGN